MLRMLVGSRVNPLAEGLPVIAERLRRLKPNGSLLRRARLTDLVELEAMTAAVQAKRLGWEAPQEIAADRDDLDSTQLDCLIDRADDQELRLDRIRLSVVRATLDHG